MSEAAYTLPAATRSSHAMDAPSHSLLVRVTHWINVLSFVGLLVSGIAILLAHPRLYWGETGSVGTPSLFDLPLPFVLVGQSGWGRSLHFLSAWGCVLNGMIYAISGILGRHFKGNRMGYELLQRLTYLTVIFALFPLIVWTGLAMSPAITSVFPILVTTFGGQQSARTIHLFVAAALVIFLLVHVFMVWRAGFRDRLGAMIAGGRKERT